MKLLCPRMLRGCCQCRSRGWFRVFGDGFWGGGVCGGGVCGGPRPAEGALSREDGAGCHAWGVCHWCRSVTHRGVTSGRVSLVWRCHLWGMSVVRMVPLVERCHSGWGGTGAGPACAPPRRHRVNPRRVCGSGGTRPDAAGGSERLCQPISAAPGGRAAARGWETSLAALGWAE